MAVEQDRLDLRQQRVVLIDVAPARLDHADLGVGEVRHQTHQEIAGREEIGVENRDELAAGDLEAGLERAGLEPGPVATVDVLDVNSLRSQPVDRQFGDAARHVRRVVQDLDLQTIARVLDGAHRLDQTIRDVHLVVERQLDRDNRERLERRERLRLAVTVPHVQVHEVVAMPSVNRENDQGEKVGGERRGFSGGHGSHARGSGPPPRRV